MKAILPWPPSANHMYWDSGPRHLKPQAKAFYKRVWATLLERLHMPRRIAGPVELTVWLWPPDLRVRDADNTLKAIQDALTKSKVVWDDDRQVRALHVYFDELRRPDGRVGVKVVPLPEGYHPPEF